MDPHQFSNDLSRSFDSRVRATERDISGAHPSMKSSRWGVLGWFVAALLVVGVLGAAVVGFVILRG